MSIFKPCQMMTPEEVKEKYLDLFIEIQTMRECYPNLRINIVEPKDKPTFDDLMELTVYITRWKVVLLNETNNRPTSVLKGIMGDIAVEITNVAVSYIISNEERKKQMREDNNIIVSTISNYVAKLQRQHEESLHPAPR